MFFLCILQFRDYFEISSVLFKCLCDVGKTLGFKDDGQERILETLLVQKCGLIKGQGKDLWAEELHLGHYVLPSWEGVMNSVNL